MVKTRGLAIDAAEVGLFAASDKDHRSSAQQLEHQRGVVEHKLAGGGYTRAAGTMGTIPFEPSRVHEWRAGDTGGLCGANALACVAGPFLSGAFGAKVTAPLGDGSSDVDDIVQAAGTLPGLRGFSYDTLGATATTLLHSIATATAGSHLLMLPRASGGLHWLAVFPSRGCIVDRPHLVLRLPTSEDGISSLLSDAGYDAFARAAAHVEIRLRAPVAHVAPQPSMVVLAGKKRKRKAVASMQFKPKGDSKRRVHLRVGTAVEVLHKYQVFSAKVLQRDGTKLRLHCDCDPAGVHIELDTADPVDSARLNPPRRS